MCARGGEKQIEVTPFEKLGQALGFTPRRVAEMYEGLSAVKNRGHGIELRRGELLDQFAAASRDRDLRALGVAMREIQAFNGRNPQAAISQETIQRSLVNRCQREAGMREGITMPRKKEYLRAEGAFSNLQRQEPSIVCAGELSLSVFPSAASLQAVTLDTLREARQGRLMLGLKLRDEFRGAKLQGTTIDFSNDSKTGALDRGAEEFLRIT